MRHFTVDVRKAETEYGFIPALQLRLPDRQRGP